jgi:hypothetical protein
MANIKSISVIDNSWTPQPQVSDKNTCFWKSRRGDFLTLKYFDLPPDIPGPLSRPDFLWKTIRIQMIWNQAAPVDIYTGTIGQLPFLAQITKFSVNGQMNYQGSIIIPRSSFSFTFIVQSGASAENRESYVEQRILAGICDSDQRARRWFHDPFSFDLITPVARNAADDEMWDNTFPDHQLTRIREIMRALPQTIAVDASVLPTPPFEGPAVTAEREREIRDFFPCLRMSR